MEIKKEIKNYDVEMSDDVTMFLDYHSYNLKTLAEKIRLQTIKPKPKMLFY